MTDGHDNQEEPRPPFDELKSKRFGRRVRRAIEFREEVLSRDPDSIVEPASAAAVLGLQVEDLATEMDEGRLGFAEVEGERVIRVADLQSAFDEETRRLKEFAEGWTKLRAEIDWDDE